uniref:Testis-specific serine/threonine-protein kinase 1 n=1 Tax=Aceria tosichella TaxID=561515 RepID=A0A6G1SBL9_9ACAR
MSKEGRSDNQSLFAKNATQRSRLTTNKEERQNNGGTLLQGGVAKSVSETESNDVVTNSQTEIKPPTAAGAGGGQKLKSPAQIAAKSPTFSDSEKDILCPAVKLMGYTANGDDTVGEGAFSRVYRARSTKVPNKDIAVKIVRLDDPKIPVAWKEYSMKRELKILNRIKHPNVINVYDVIKTHSRIYIFMDMAATSVTNHLEATKKPTSEQTARTWFGGISNAISYLHHLEVAHRDLKNDNILIDFNGQAKLTDFGFACFTYDRHKKEVILSNTSCGTKVYVAPEVFNPPYNAKFADVWSLGVCLFECVTLSLPFPDNLPPQLFLKRTQRGLVIPKKFRIKLDPSLQELLGKMIEPDVNKRLRSEAIMVHPWIRVPRN